MPGDVVAVRPLQAGNYIQCYPNSSPLYPYYSVWGRRLTPRFSLIRRRMPSLSDVGSPLSGLGLVAGAIIAFCNLALPARKRKYMTVDAVRHHATYAIKNIQE